MPGLFHRPIDRRLFLQHSAALAGLVAISPRARSADRPTAGAAENKPVHFALLSDTHVAADPANEYRRFKPFENLKQVAAEVAEVNPEGILIDGDAARLSGELADYEQLKSLLAPLAESAPVYIGLGNHDDRAHFSKVFESNLGPREKVTDKHVLVIEKPAVRFLLLDSLLYVNRVAGLLGKAQREWLAAFLENSDSKPTLLFLHHTLGDRDGDLLDTDRFFDLIRPHRKVKAVFYGHSHEYAYAEEAGIHLVNLPAVGYNFRDTEPVGWVDARFTAEGAELTLRAIGGDRTRHGQKTTLTWRT